MPYIKVFKDFISIAEALDNGQRGKLFLAILQYANDMEVEPLNGVEKIAFLTMKNQIDRDRRYLNESDDEEREKAERRAEIARANGRKGGRPKTQKNPEKTQENPAGFSETQKTQDKDYNNDRNYDDDYDDDHSDDNNNDSPGAGAAGDELCAYASGNLQHMSPDAIDELLSFRDCMSDDLIRYAINVSCDNGAPRWAYTRTILRKWQNSGIRNIGDAKAEKRTKRSEQAGNPALQFNQRQYDDLNALIFGRG